MTEKTIVEFATFSPADLVRIEYAARQMRAQALKNLVQSTGRRITAVVAWGGASRARTA